MDFRAGAVMAIVVLIAAAALGWYILAGAPETPPPAPRAPEAVPVPEAPPTPVPAPLPEPVAAPHETSTPTATGSGVIHGRVVDEEGRPLGQVEVVAATADGLRPDDLDAPPPAWRAESAVDGTFLLEALPLETIQLTAWHGGQRAGAKVGLTEDDPEQSVVLAARVVSGSLRGWVTDEAGAPVAGAMVFTCSVQGPMGEQAHDPEDTLGSAVVTDADGRFAMPWLGMIEARLCARAPDYAPAISGMVKSGSDEVTLVLTRGGGLLGSLTDANSGEPLADMRIWAFLHGAASGRETVTDHEGRFQFAHLTPGENELRLHDSPYILTETPAKAVVREGVDTQGVRLLATLGGSILGRVYDVDSGRGISGVTVEAHTPGFVRRSVAKGRTDDNGEYRMAGLTQGRYSLSLREPAGYVLENQLGPMAAQVALGQESSAADFPLRRGIAVRGKVVDAEGNPVAAATVRPEEGMFLLGIEGSNRTDEHGAFLLALAPGTEQVTLRADYPGYTSGPVGPLDVPAEGMRDVVLRLEAGATIAGTVVNATGLAPAMTMVWGRRDGQPWAKPLQYVEPDGAFTIRGLGAGTYKLAPQSTATGVMMPDMNEAVEVTLAKGQHVTGVRLVLAAPAGPSISGQVVDSSGRPISGVQVMATSQTGIVGVRTLDEIGDVNIPRTAVADAQGRFEVKGLADGGYHLTTHHADYSGASSSAEAGAENVTIVLYGYGAIEGRVIEARTRQPVTAFEALASHEGTRQIEEWQQRSFTGFRDEAGAFRLEDVDVGGHTVIVRAEGYAPAFVDVAGVLEGETVSGVVVEMRSPARLTGVVLDPRGQPVEGAEVCLGSGYFPADNDELPDISAAGHVQRSDADGRFVFKDQPPGVTRLRARKQGFVMASLEVHLVEGGEKSVEIVLSDGGAVEGYVTLNGGAVPGANVSVYPSAAVEEDDSDMPYVDHNARTDDQGFYRIGALPEGAASVHCSIREGTGQRSKSIDATLTTGLIVNANFDFQSAGNASVEGYITDVDGTALRGAHISIFMQSADPEGQGVSATSDAEGYYRLDGLAPGRTMINVMKMPDVSIMGSDETPEMQTFTPKVRNATIDLLDGKVLRQDFSFAGGCTVVCGFVDAPVGANMIAATAFKGALPFSLDELAAMDENSPPPEMPEMMGTGFSMDGSPARIENLPPGAYTILGVALSSSGSEDTEPETLPRRNMAKAELTLTSEGQTIEVDLVFGE